MNVTTKEQLTGPFQKLRSSFREIFGKTEAPTLQAKDAGKEMTGKDREKLD